MLRTHETQSPISSINSVLLGKAARRNAFSHEVAHNFGLNRTADGTLSNQTASSLYNIANGLNDTTTGAPGPTNCDRQVINSTYGAGGVRYTAPRPAGGGGGGGGGYYYPCTPHYWHHYESYGGGQWQLVNVSYAGCW